MDVIELDGLEFFSFHGVMAQEQSIGNRYTVNLLVYLDLNDPGSDDQLESTVNYLELYQIVSEVMRQRHQLLERIGVLISQKIKLKFDQIKKVEVQVSKHNPPIGGLCKKATVKVIR